ncbi:cdc42-interacting protein 4 isoform X2 [Oryctolagus cuniculus]|uniref:cdc42-interacting protein 4 isoform X2 n=1 Tax=Oryctolagus cuniculus TaxID=9986 RepID=UPI002232B8DB|nr:cdc42-interacting protein 4 isoform X2 [Oryctolagus cuniculus]
MASSQTRAYVTPDGQHQFRMEDVIPRSPAPTLTNHQKDRPGYSMISSPPNQLERSWHPALEAEFLHLTLNGLRLHYPECSQEQTRATEHPETTFPSTPQGRTSASHPVGRGSRPELWLLDQFEVLERHTQWGLDLLDRYVKFVKERAEVEQAYAKQLRNLVKKYLPKRLPKDDPESKFSQQQSFVQILQEVNDFAGQRELVAENLGLRVCLELAKYSQEMRQERKMHFQEGRRAQQQLETGFKQLENSKRKFERDCREAEKAAQTAERLDQDINATKADVEKAKQQAHLRSHMAEESKNEYAAQLQRFNRDQAHFYFSQMPQIFDKLQDMDERRASRLGAGYGLLSEAELQVVPIIAKCLEGMKVAAEAVDAKNDSQVLIELHKSGFARPGDVEFEDFSQPMNRAPSDSSLGTPADGRPELRGPGRSRAKRWPFGKKSKLRSPPLSPLGGSLPPALPNGPPSPRSGLDPLALLSEISKSVKPRLASLRSLRGGRATVVTEDFSHLPPEQQRKRLQQQLEERSRELQKEVDQREALKKMKDVYEKTPQMGDPASLEPQIAETLSNIERLKLEVQKYEAWLAEAESRVISNRGDSLGRHTRPPDPPSSAPPADSDSNKSGSQENKGSVPEAPSEEAQDGPIYTEFDEDFEEEPASPIGHCVAIYHFEGSSEGTISMAEGEDLSLIEEDKGDGWTRVRRKQGGEGYVPTSYLRVTLN